MDTRKHEHGYPTTHPGVFLGGLAGLAGLLTGCLLIIEGALLLLL